MLNKFYYYYYYSIIFEFEKKVDVVQKVKIPLKMNYF